MYKVETVLAYKTWHYFIVQPLPIEFFRFKNNVSPNITLPFVWGVWCTIENNQRMMKVQKAAWVF